MSDSLVTAEPKHLSQPVRVSRVWPHQGAWSSFQALVMDCHAKLVAEGRQGEAGALLRVLDALANGRSTLGVFLATWGPRPVAFLLMAPGEDVLWRRVMWVEGVFMGSAPFEVRRAARDALLARLVFESREQGVSHVVAEVVVPAMGRYLSLLGFRPMAVTYEMEIVL